ncbi:hypothetical protein AHF37_12747 [Paragonimus kellicotti]|nr:hypothetical protein AHF37_12747 [Paragonimus kellicotti]
MKFKFRRRKKIHRNNSNLAASVGPTEEPTNQEEAISVKNCVNCCEDFSTYFPFSFNIFLPGTKEIVREFVVSRHRLTTSGLRCRLRLGLNTFDSGCAHGKERVLRVEGVTRNEVITCVDLLDSVFPEWKVWKRGKSDADLL